MSSLKPLKSIAHNVAHHFASTLSYWKDDYSINHVWNTAKKHNVNKVKIDVLNSKTDPEIINEGRVKELLPGLQAFFKQLIKSESMSEVELESVILEYDFGVNRVSSYALPTYDCKLLIKTTSGKTYEALLTEANN